MYLCSKHYDELEEELDEDMKRRTMHLSSADVTPDHSTSAEKQHRVSGAQVMVTCLSHARGPVHTLCWAGCCRVSQGPLVIGLLGAVHTLQRCSGATIVMLRMQACANCPTVVIQSCCHP